MLYLKRIISLILMVAFAWINHFLIKQNGAKFTINTVVFCIINVIIVILIVYGYHISKAIKKNIFIMIAEYLILALLMITAFAPQIDGVTGNVLMARLNLTLDDFRFIHMMQFVLGYWIVSFVNIFKSVHIKRGQVINSIKF